MNRSDFEEGAPAEAELFLAINEFFPVPALTIAK